MDTKKFFMRKHSSVVRKWTGSANLDSMTENPACHLDGSQRIVMVTLCRIKQRTLAQAWEYWIRNSGVVHDYREDVRMILTKPIPNDDLRSELEIEVLYKWILQVKDIDPTGIAGTIHICKKRQAVYQALQQLRLETYSPGEPIIFQGDLPRAEDGHFTILTGECDVLQFPDGSVPLTKLQQLSKGKLWDEAKVLLNSAQIVAKIPELSGFGELSTLTGVKRAATVRTSKKLRQPIEIIVLPKIPLLDCLKYRPSNSGEASTQSEAIDFLRQSGLANRISPKDLVSAAAAMTKRTYLEGDVLFYKGEPVQCIYLVVSGEVLLDIGDYLVNGKPLPFVHATAERCFHLSSGSILGDEGVIGTTNVFESTAAIVSSAAVIFEARGFGMNFIAEKMGYLRYTALYYRDKLRWDFSNQLAEQINPFTFFNSLRKIVGGTKPFRGTMTSAEFSTEYEKLLKEKQAAAKAAAEEAQNKAQKSSNHQSRGGKGANNSVDRLSSPVRGAKRHHGNTYHSSGNDHDAHDHTDPNNQSSISGFKLPTRLPPVGLHRALDVNRICKRNVQVSVKMHAKENILYEQLSKETQGGDKLFDEDHVRSEHSFNHSVKEYYERAAEKTRRLLEEEEARKVSMKTPSAIRFFALGGGGGGDDGEDSDTSIGKGDPDGDGGRSRSNSQESLDSEANSTTEFADGAVSLPQVTTTLGAPLTSGRYNMNSVDDSPKRNTMITFQENNITFYNQEGNAAKSKLEQYYNWLDSLHRPQFRNLARFIQMNGLNMYANDNEIDSYIKQQHQSNQQTDHAVNHHSYSHTPLLPTNWRQILKIFQRYSLNPLDEKLYANAGATAAGNPGMVRPITEETRASTASVTELLLSARSAPGSAKSSPVRGRTPGTKIASLDAVKNIPLSNLVASMNSSTATSSTFAFDESASRRKSTAPVEKVKVTYTPSSWKNDLKNKKLQEPTKDAPVFCRPKTPDTRRIFASLSHCVEEVGNPKSDQQVNNENKQYPTSPTHSHQKTTKGHAKTNVAMENYIDSPEEFMQIITQTDLTNVRKRLEFEKDRLEWKTRFLTATSNNKGKEKKPKSILESVRTHLKEDLTAFTKDQLLDNVEHQKKKNVTPFIRTMLGKELANYSVAPSPKSDTPFNLSRSMSRTNSICYPAAPLLQLPSAILTANPSTTSLPALPMVLPAIQSGAIITKIEQTTKDGKMEGNIVSAERILHHEEEDLLQNSLSTSMSLDEEGLPTKVEEQQSNELLSNENSGTQVAQKNAAVLPAHNHVTSTVGTDGIAMLTPIVAVATEMIPTGAATPITDSAKHTPHIGSTPTPLAKKFFQPKERVSDSKAPSKALAAFDEFMSTQQDRQKINLEGRRKANRNSKFRIRPVSDPYADLVELKTTYQERLRTELAIFEALHPNSTKKDREEFTAKFQSIYPDLTVGIKEEAKLDLDTTSRNSGSSPILSKPTTPQTPNSPSLGPLGSTRSRQQSPAAGGRTKKGANYSDEEEDIEYDPELEAWQKYTVKDIVSTKTGERKTLPVVTLPRSVQAVTTVRSNRANRGGNGVLVTLPAEKDELLIKGPPSYLELYKRGFRVHTSSKAKAKIIEELRQRAENSEIS